MRVVISSGHSKHVSGAVGIINEVSEARRVVPQIAKYLYQYGIQTIQFHDDASRTQSENVNRIVRFHNENKRDLDVSIHFNSIAGVREEGIGVETCYRKGNAQTKNLASNVSKSISKASGLILRRGDGTFPRTDLGFLNNTNKPAILLEICFVNSTTDVDLYRKNFDAICEAIAKEIAKYGGIAIDNKPSIEQPNNNEIISKTPIMGIARISKQIFLEYAKGWRKEPILNTSIEELINLYYEIGKIEGVRPEIALVQAILETGRFQYGGQVSSCQNNFAGIGAVDGGGAGASFETPLIGVMAHIQHLKAYATKDDLALLNQSPRLHFVRRGSASYIEYLSIPNNPHGVGWASDPNYASKLNNIYKGVLRMAVEQTVDNAIKDGVIVDKEHWTKVLMGEIPANHEFVRIVFDRYSEKVNRK